MDETEVVEDKSGYIPKAKKPMSEAQLAALAKARQKAYELRQQKKNVVNIDSSSEEDEEKDRQPKPEPEKPKGKPRQRKTKPKSVQKEEPMKEDKSEASDEDESCCMTAAPSQEAYPKKSCLRKCSHRNIYLYYEDE